MTLRGAVWTGVALAAIGIGGLVFTSVAGASGLHVPWTQSRVAQGYGGMMAAGSAAGGYAGMMAGGGGGYGGMMGQAAAGNMMGGATTGSARTVVSAAEAQSLGAAVPAGATVDRAGNRVTFASQDVRLTMLASPDNGPDMTFRVAGLADPTIVVPQGARVTVQLINADSGTMHGWLLSAAEPPFPYMAMMDAPAAFSGSFAVPLGAPTSAGMPGETITFTASQVGQYTYFCPIPGHAQRGMHGAFDVVA